MITILSADGRFENRQIVLQGKIVDRWYVAGSHIAASFWPTLDGAYAGTAEQLIFPLLPQQGGEQTPDAYVELGSALRRIMAEDEQFAGNMRDRVGISKVLLGYTDAVMRRRAVEIIHHLDRALNAAVLPQVGEALPVAAETTKDQA